MVTRGLKEAIFCVLGQGRRFSTVGFCAKRWDGLGSSLGRFLGARGGSPVHR